MEERKWRRQKAEGNNKNGKKVNQRREKKGGKSFRMHCEGGGQ
jgi:hypothetical protein